MIGNWDENSNYSEKNENCKYHILLNDVKIIVNKINSHVLECTLPSFDFNLKATLLHIYENDNLVCDPLPFRIKYTKACYKPQLFILERLLAFFKIYQLNSFDLNIYSSSQNSRDQNFELRCCKLINSLINNLNILNPTQLADDLRSHLENEFEGKTLLHLCAEAGFDQMFKCLRSLSDLAESKSILLQNETKLTKLDDSGYTPMMLACKYGNVNIALEIFKWEKTEFEKEIVKDQQLSLTSSPWYLQVFKSIEVAEQNGHFNISKNLNNLFSNFRTEIESIEKIKKQIIPDEYRSDNYTQSENVDTFFHLENLDDLACILNDDSFLEPKKLNANDLHSSEDINFDFYSNTNQNDFPNLNCFLEPQLVTVPNSSAKTDEEQDKKIKTLADNIIAAMPHKIKSNCYSSFNLNQQKGLINFEAVSNSFDETFTFNDPRISLSSCQSSSSTRSSLSPTLSLSFQYNSNSNQTNLIDDSNGDDSTCSSTFHIDSPPSTAEFCQYFHASSSSGYYKNAIETGFSQLTLTDDEQRELYEAALVIQNAYRRYILRKKKKTVLDFDSLDAIDDDSLNKIGQAYASLNNAPFMDEVSLSRCSTSSLSSLASNTSKMSDRSNTKVTDKEESHSSCGDDHRQYEAACVIQKYYRRYKQVVFNFLHI